MSRPRTVLRRRGRKARNRVGAPDILWLALRRMWQRTFVVEHLAEITAVDPAVAGGAPDEVLGLALRGIAQKPPQKFATRNVCHLAKAVTHASLPEPRGHEASP